MERRLLGLSLMSQVKPGPKREEAVAMKVSRRESREEKELSMFVRKSGEQISEGGWGVDVYLKGYLAGLVCGLGRDVMMP